MRRSSCRCATALIEYFGLPYSVDMWPGHPDLITNLPASLAAIKREYPNLPIYDGEKNFRPGNEH